MTEETPPMHRCPRCSSPRTQTRTMTKREVKQGDKRVAYNPETGPIAGMRCLDERCGHVWLLEGTWA